MAADICVVDSLIVALDDKDPEVRRIAAESLGVLGDKRAVEPLIRELASEVWETVLVVDCSCRLRSSYFVEIPMNATRCLSNGRSAIPPSVLMLKYHKALGVLNAARYS